ncbi:hypothetical protein DUNSADRAFT_2194 [Dunaliella salina]|uniref:Encoded protein n=1 Tax=Dunaliella salina TaxID=3046 RepID=A0ABQ7GW15_DUNSA|nr:hypothetical protein DUNSADRAFT_2194 [Dunaliella salina]|eukprot:KAF5838809.1 hypothetical protein DUNSADRAFT_2194 [Dunaliella salina]
MSMSAMPMLWWWLASSQLCGLIFVALVRASSMHMELADSVCHSCFHGAQQDPLHVPERDHRNTASQKMECSNKLIYMPTHVFATTIDGKGLAMCVPQKNGNRFWSLLPYRTQISEEQFHSIPMENGFRGADFGDVARRLQIHFKGPDARRFYLTDERVLRVMIVRTPRRLISKRCQHEPTGRWQGTLIPDCCPGT